MINFDCYTLERFVEENKNFFEYATIQKIQQPTRQEFIFFLRNQGETRKLYININPKFFHVCFMNKKNEEKRFLQIPQKPPMFCMLLRKYLGNSRIVKISQPKNERILEFYFRTYDETGEEIYLCLAIELMGKHSNIILYNYDTNVIIGCAHNVGEDKSKVRELYGGLPYTYPPKSSQTKFNGLFNIFNSNENINSQIDNYFADIQAKKIFKNLQTKLFLITKNNLKKANNTLEKINKQTKSQEKTDLYRKKGDLIMANLYSNQDFVSEIEVIDYETNLPIKIELDETKTLKENANKFYALYTKSKTALQKTKEMTKQLNLQKEYMEEVLFSIESAQEIEVLLEIEEEIDKKNTTKKIREKTKITSIEKESYIIYIGKNNKQNDYIISKLAKKEDLWFHTHNCAGSHVLLRMQSGCEITDKIIFECAKLAKENSSAKNSSKVGVIYTKAKNLRKPPAANLGYVTYKNEKEIIID